MTPEIKALQLIDQKLEQAGWVIQDMKALNLGASLGVAVREYPTDTGAADYVLFVKRQAVGVIEAKKDSAAENLTAVEQQTERYATATLKWRTDQTPLRFLFQASGQIIRFTDNADPAPRSREIFHFFSPESLAEWAGQPDTLRRRLAETMPVLPERNLRDCQIKAVRGLEQSLTQNQPRALIHMATGAGKTFTAITQNCTSNLNSRQIKARATSNSQVIQTAMANSLDKFQLGVRKLIEDLMIQRMAENDKMVTRYMEDAEFQRVAFPVLSKEIYEAIAASSETHQR